MITITHNGTDITDIVNSEGFSAEDARNSERDMLTFTIEKSPGGFTPELNAEIIATRDGTRIFGGSILSLETSVPDHQTVVYQVECVDFTHQLDRRLVTERFIDETASEIITFLRDNYAADFTLNNVVADFVVDRISFNRLPVSQCLDKLAKLNRYVWYVDYNKDIHFFARNAEPAPFNITDTSGDYVLNSLRIRSDLSQLRNLVFVEGGESPIAARTTKATGDGETTEFATNYKFDTAPTVTVDGVEQTVGVEYLDDSGFDCYWSRAEKYVRFETAPPRKTDGSGDTVPNIEMTGNPLVPIVAEVPDDDSIAEFGTFEHALKEKTLQSQDQIIDRGIAELEAHAEALNEASFNTTTPGLRSGQIITIDSTLHGVTDEYVIQRVSFVPYPNGAALDGVWSVTLASTASISLIDTLRKLLAEEELEDDELKTLLAYFAFADEATASDTLDTPTTTERPYLLADENGDVAPGNDPFICNFALLEP